MELVGEYQDYQIWWSNPEEDGGSGTGEVWVGGESVGVADTESEAVSLGEQHIGDYLGKIDNMDEVDE